MFHEQLMRMAMAIGGINGDEANLLRRAMGSNAASRRSPP
jgi:error-prone DNA polymerase